MPPAIDISCSWIGEVSLSIFLHKLNEMGEDVESPGLADTIFHSGYENILGVCGTHIEEARTVSIEDDFHAEMLEIYYRAGRECGYWANRYLPKVRLEGGLPYARRLLSSSHGDSVQAGFQALTDAGRSDISVEALVIRPQYSDLFSEAELAEARQRLDTMPEYTKRKAVSSAMVFPETLPPDLPYIEGAVRKVTINAYERDPKARAACLEKYGYDCAVCSMNFSDEYGAIGEHFMHVHHKKPLATIRAAYVIDPVKDLVPVCPNCHAMLHTCEPPLSVEELKKHRELRRDEPGG